MGNQSVLYILLVGLSLCSSAIVSEEGSNRILDGQIAAEGQFPYAVSIQLLGAPQLLVTRGHRCGGALVTLQHVITVANCLFDMVGGVPVPISPTQYRVFAGANLLTNDTTADRIRPIANYTIHPEYTGQPALVNNIAIITLSTPFSAAVVSPLALPATNFEPRDFTQCTVTGWGAHNASEQTSPQLRYANKYTYNQNLCTTLYNSISNIKNILPTMICAVSYDLLSSNCLGDDGNALVCGGIFTGVLSLSDGCTKSSYPEVYTRISNYTTWIRSVSGSAPTFSEGVFVMITMFSLIQIYFSM